MAYVLEIARHLEEIKAAFNKIKQEMADTRSELASVNRGLRLDSGNVELLAQRSALLAKQLQENREKSEQLGKAIEYLNQIKEESGKLDATQAKQLDSFTKQQREAQIQVIALTGVLEKQAQAEREAAEAAAKLAEESGNTAEAIQHQGDTTQAAEEKTKSFSESMTEFQSNLRAVNQVMRGVSNAFTLLGGDADSGLGKVLNAGEKSIQMMTSMASASKLLGKENNLLSSTFGTLALSAGAAVAAYSLGSTIINAFGEDAKTAAGIITALSAVVIAGAIAWTAFHGAASLGTTIPVIVAAVGSGIAGIKALTSDINSATANLGNPMEYAGATSSGTMPQSYAINVPTYYGSSSAQSQSIVQTLSEKQIENAAYNGMARAIIETGLNQKEYIATSEINGRVFARYIFSDLVAINKERGEPL